MIYCSNVLNTLFYRLTILFIAHWRWYAALKKKHGNNQLNNCAFAINGVSACPAIVSQVRSRHKRSGDDHRKDKPESSILWDSKAVLLLTDVSHGFNRVTGPSMLLYWLLSEVQTQRHEGGNTTVFILKYKFLIVIFQID